MFWSDPGNNEHYHKHELDDLLYQVLETEQAGTKICAAAIGCARSDDLRTEWQEYLDDTRAHEKLLLDIFSNLGLDPYGRTPGRDVVAYIGESLVAAMEKAKENDDAQAAEVVAGECVVVLAETKEHLNQSMTSRIAQCVRRDEIALLKEARDAVEEEGELFHTASWMHELWIASSGVPTAEAKPNGASTSVQSVPETTAR